MKIKIGVLHILVIIMMISILTSLGLKLYVSTELLPLGSRLKSLEKHYEELSDSTFENNKESAYYSSTELVRAVAQESFNMKISNSVIFIDNNKLAFNNEKSK